MKTYTYYKKLVVKLEDYQKCLDAHEAPLSSDFIELKDIVQYQGTTYITVKHVLDYLRQNIDELSVTMLFTRRALMSAQADFDFSKTEEAVMLISTPLSKPSFFVMFYDTVQKELAKKRALEAAEEQQRLQDKEVERQRQIAQERMKTFAPKEAAKELDFPHHALLQLCRKLGMMVRGGNPYCVMETKKYWTPTDKAISAGYMRMEKRNFTRYDYLCCGNRTFVYPHTRITQLGMDMLRQQLSTIVVEVK